MSVAHKGETFVSQKLDVSLDIGDDVYVGLFIFVHSTIPNVSEQAFV